MYDKKIEKIEKAVGFELSPDTKEQLVQIFDFCKCNKTAPNLSLFVDQIQLGLTDLFERTRRIRTELTAKDSSSLKSFELRYGNEEGKKRYEEKTKRCVNTRERYINDFGEEQGAKKWDEYIRRKSLSLDGFQIRYGKEDGEKRFREFWDSATFATTKKGFILRFGEEQGPIEFEKFRINQGYNNTLKAFVEKYGKEEGERLYYERNKKKSVSCSKNTFVSKLLEQGLSDEEVQKSILDRWSNTSLQSFIKRYGETDGLTKYKDFLEKNKKSNPVCIEYYTSRGIPEKDAFYIISDVQLERAQKINRFSKESLDNILPCLETIVEDRLLFKEEEKCIKLTSDEHRISGKRLCFYDFCFENLKLIIEYHGERFHDDVDYTKTIQMGFDDFEKSYNLDLFKKWIAEQRGYDVFIVRSWHLKNDLIDLFYWLQNKGVTVCKTNFF